MDENTNKNSNIENNVQNESLNTETKPETDSETEIKPSETQNPCNKQESDTTDSESSKQNEEHSEADEEAAPDKSDTIEGVRWDYPDREEDVKVYLPKKKKVNGGFIFAIIAVSAFVIALAILFASMLITGVAESNTNVNVDYSDVSVMDFASVETIERAKNSTVLIVSKSSKGTSSGSGIIMDYDGHIATNYHVIQNSTDITVTLYNDISYKATVVGYSEIDDLAVIKIKGGNLSPAIFGISSNLTVCQNVYAIGCPGGADLAFSVSRGTISCAQREIRIYNSSGILERKMNVIQTDTALNHGNSGGPLVDAKGRVIGIVSMKLASSNGVDYEGIGFAIPIDGALEILRAIIETGSADNINSSVSSPRPVLGITGKTIQGENWYTRESITNPNTNPLVVTEEQAKTDESMHFYASQSGVVVVGFTEGQDAQNKLQQFDIITKINGVTITNINQAMEVINRMYPGDTVDITVCRGSDTVTCKITLGS